MLEFIVKGFLLGLFVSMPLGPLAVLCIQRTLNKGRWHGFATGVGIAFSDMVYALIAGLGMSFVIAFVTHQQHIIQLIGSCVICLFGVYIFRSNPVKKIAPVSSPQNYFQDFITAFFITISNPMILFLFIGLYARFNFIHTDENNHFAVFKTILGVLFIFIGALTWWFSLVSIINLFRHKFNVRSLWIINKVMGSIIIILGIIGFILSLTGESVM